NDSLFMIIPERTVWLKHYHYDIFQPFNVDKKEGIDTTENNPLRLQFNMSSTGEIINITMPLQPGLKDIEFRRIPKPKEMTKAELEKYVGEFEFAPGTTVKFYIKGEHTLYAFIQGQPEYELVPTDTNKFALKILSGYSVEFEENNKGEVISATFNQPNGKFKATKKTK
ncbi:MAG: serine hydrolase, partial [Bacteroidetes bacterium]|nr:serine hydrolase [Bacteroidota bacterium]